MAIVNDIVIEQFETLTKFSLAQLLLDFSDFINNNRTSITDYYSGLTQSPDEESFRELSRLIEEFERLNNVIENNRDRLTHTLYWELLETISDIRIVLDTIDNSPRWLRSAIARNDFTPGLEVEHTLKMFQTLENVSQLIQGSSDPQNEWVTIAFRNSLREEDYTVDGGNQLQLGFRNRATIQIRSIVDTINGESVYGKDFKRKLSISTSDEEIDVLSPKETIRQTVDILGALKQGDTPEFRGEGIQSGLVVGGNRASISYPVLRRQIVNTFQKDDTLKALRITNISNRDDGVFIEMQVETRINEIISAEIPV